MSGRYSLVEEVGDDLELHGGLADLARSADGDDGRDVGVDAAADALHEVAPGRRGARELAVVPPWVVDVEVVDQCLGKHGRHVAGVAGGHAGPPAGVGGGLA